MAEHLFQVESGRTSQGLVMAVLATIDSTQWIILSKIEHEKGVQVQLETTDAGERTFSLTYLNNLIFAETTKVYKIAAFSLAGSQAGSPITGYAADPQNGRAIADVWLHDFLGCDYVERPEVLTERFYEGVTKAVSTVASLSPAQAAQVEIALLAEMNKAGIQRHQPEVFRCAERPRRASRRIRRDLGGGGRVDAEHPEGHGEHRNENPADQDRHRAGRNGTGPAVDVRRR